MTALRKIPPEWYRADVEALFELLSTGAICPRVANRIGLGDVPAARVRIGGGHVDGKIVTCP